MFFTPISISADLIFSESMFCISLFVLSFSGCVFHQYRHQLWAWFLFGRKSNLFTSVKNQIFEAHVVLGHRLYWSKYSGWNFESKYLKLGEGLVSWCWFNSEQDRVSGWLILKLILQILPLGNDQIKSHIRTFLKSDFRSNLCWASDQNLAHCKRTLIGWQPRQT